jgi:hypothetical protein
MTEQKLHWRYKQKLDALLASDIPDSCRFKHKSCATFRQVIQKIEEGGKRKVYLSGGLVRDLVSGEDISAADVDVKFSRMSKADLIKLFEKMGLASSVQTGKGYTYFFVGCNQDVQLEGSMLEPPGGPPSMESPANALYIDLSTSTLHDPTGVGIEDAKKRVWRIPPNANKDDWYDRPRAGVLLWRMMKFRIRGFKVPREDVVFLYRKFAAAEKAGGVKPSEYRNVINQVPDTVAMVELMIRDAGEYGVRDEVALIASKLLGSEQVFVKVEEKGNVPFQTLCNVQRRESIKQREAKRSGQNKFGKKQVKNA